MNRGDMYWVNLDPTMGSEIKKKRPCLILSVNPINRARKTLIVVPLSTSAIVRFPIVMPVICDGKDVTIVCDQIRTVDKSRLGSKIGEVDKKQLKDIEKSIKIILGLS